MEIIKLNLIPSGVNPTCHCSQYDEGRVIRIELFDGLTPYALKSGDAVTLNVRKPDNTIVTTTLSTTQGNKYVDLVTTEQICACVGYNLCDLTITNGSVVIGTLNFIMQVERDVLADGIPSQSVIEDLDSLVQEAVGDNYYTKTETDNLLNAKANQSTTYSKSEVDMALASKADSAELERVENILGYTEEYIYPINRFNKADEDNQDGYSFNSSGNPTQNADFFLSGYINTDGLEGIKCIYATTTVQNVNAYYVCYDGNKTKIGSRNSSGSSGTPATLETGTKYIRVAYNLRRKDGFMVVGGNITPTEYISYSEPIWVDRSSVIDDIQSDIDTIEAQIPPEIKVGAGQTYTSLLAALKNTDSSVILHLMAQEFDIEAEYKAFYGASFFDDYDDYSNHPDDPFYRGLWLADGRKVIGEAGTKIKFLYSGNNSNVHTYFSVFANGKNTSLENVEIFVNQNVRYSIHDDFKPSDGSVIWKNIIFHGKPHSSAHIGAGLGYGATYYLEGLIFLENDSLYDISYHGVATSNPNVYINKVYVKNCYGTKACAFRWYGINTGVSPCIVSNSTFGSIYCEAYDSEQTIENMILYKYNCIETAQ